jgi:alkaline phosphatase D
MFQRAERFYWIPWVTNATPHLKNNERGAGVNDTMQTDVYKKMKYLLMSCLCLGVAASTSGQGTPAGPLTVIGFGSCAQQGAPQPIWKAVNATKPEVFVMLGDNIYGDTTDMAVLQGKYEQLGADPGFQQLRNATRMLATWDDHDFGQNDAGTEYPMKRESQRLFMDFFKIPADAPMRSRDGVYSSEIIGPAGKRVQFILLDTRYFRSPLAGADGTIPGKKPYGPNNDPSSTLLGEEQWTWLEQQLREPAEIRLIFSSIQVLSQDHGGEKWMNFPHERDRLFRLLVDTNARGVIFFSGDRHLAELSVMDPGFGYPLYDLTSSGLTKAYLKGWRAPEVNRHRVSVMNTGNNFGLIKIDWEAGDPEIRLEILDEIGDLRISQKVPLSWISPQRLRGQLRKSVSSGPFQAANCDGTYPGHLQGVCTDGRDAIFWSWTERLVKTDKQGRLLREATVANHHGDLCFHNDQVFVAVNLGKFNEPAGKADSWVYVYDAATLAELARHPVPEAVHGAGGIAYHNGSFIVVGGLPPGIEENYAFEYDANFRFKKRHAIKSGYTTMGIQTAAFENGAWWFGCYGKPAILLRADESFNLTGKWEFDAALGIVGAGDGSFLVGRNSGSRKEGYSGGVITAREDRDRGLVLVEGAATPGLQATR